MHHYTVNKATFATHAEDKQPKSRFSSRELVRLHAGQWRGRLGRVQQELTGYYEVAVYGVGVETKTLLLANNLERIDERFLPKS